MQKKLVDLITLVLVLANPMQALADLADVAKRTDSICRSQPVTEKIKRSNDFAVTIGRSGDSSCHFIEVKKQEHILYREQEIGSYFYFGADVERDDSPFKRLKEGGHLNLVLSKWTGGAHCCFSLKIFDLDDGFRMVANVEGGSSVPTFKDIDGDGVPEIEVEDDFLVYRFSSFASSAVGHVILKYRYDGYKVAQELMRRPPTSFKALSRQIASWRSALRKSTTSEFPRSFMQAITDLTFSGNKVMALNFIDSAWPPDRSGKADFIKGYEEALQESQFSPEFENGL